jgi:hypothetical protein
MTISVPDSAKAVIEEQATKAGYTSPTDYLLSLVERDRRRSLREEIEAKLLEAAASPSTPFTKADWDDIEREGTRIISERSGR